MRLATTLLGRTHSFGSLKEVMAKASEPKSGDELAGVAAGDERERVAAKLVLAEVTLGELRIYNLYVPNGTELGSDAFSYKLQWLRRLRAELDATWAPERPLVIVGDFNIAPDARDVYDPERFVGQLLFTDEEHAALEELLDFGLQDCFRKHVQDGGHYSWYDYRTNGYELDEGLRIDHVYATATMAERCTEVIHDRKPRGWDTPSDHVPVTARFA